MATSVTKGGTQKLPPKIKIVETNYDHSGDLKWFQISQFLTYSVAIGYK
jgi:hypothetical protein